MELKINSLEEIGAVAEEFVRLAMQEDTVFAFNGQMGAGKTTFITEMARRCRRKFVVMENEIGAVGVDGGFLSSSLGEGIEVWEMTQGYLLFHEVGLRHQRAHHRKRSPAGISARRTYGRRHVEQDHG